MLGKLTGQDQAYTGNGLVMKLRLEKQVTTHDVWISLEEMVDFLLYAASFDASPATRSKMSVTR